MALPPSSKSGPAAQAQTAQIITAAESRSLMTFISVVRILFSFFHSLFGKPALFLVMNRFGKFVIPVEYVYYFLKVSGHCGFERKRFTGFPVSKH